MRSGVISVVGAVSTDWPMFWVQVGVGLVTLMLAGVSVSVAASAARTSRRANELSEESVRAMEKSAEISDKMRELEAQRSGAAAEREERDQASRVWVSMIVIKGRDELGNEQLEHGVLQIRNSSDRPLRNMRICSRGRRNASWFAKNDCTLPIVFPGDTIIKSRNGVTGWDIPKTYFPHFSEDYHHAVAPKDDPYYVTEVEFDDADGTSWRLENGYCLTKLE